MDLRNLRRQSSFKRGPAFECSMPLDQISHLFLSNQISIGVLCPDLTNWHDKILSKTSREVFYEYQTDVANTNDGGSA